MPTPLTNLIKKPAKLTLILLIIIVLSARLMAAEEPYTNFLRGTAVQQGAGFTVTDEKYLSIPQWNTINTVLSVTPENIVELKLNYDTSLYFSNKPFSVTVNLSIFCYNNPFDTTQVFQQYNNINLKIVHDTTSGKAYNGDSYLKFSGAYKFRVVINSITCPELGVNMPKVLILEGKTIIKRKYNFLATSADVTKIDEIGSKIKLSWTPANYQGSELFELEYTVANDSSANGASVRNYLSTGTPIPQSFLDNLFKNNATRIITNGSDHIINSLFQAGYLLFRVRGVQFPNEYRTNISVEELNLRNETQWNYQATKLNQPSYQYNVVQIQWHEPNLNWQYSAAFAEEGKKKEVMGYFDGILKSRQNVTLNNSDNKSVVQETVYDVLGRGTVNILPAPVNDSNIYYFRDFNRNLVGKGYSYKDFLAGSNCRTVPAMMSNANGAERYYSSNNNINDYFFKKYIPQAEGYPFSVTEYTADNTGRIASQGGVGKDFQPATGHETKYFYSKPVQEELDRLFGSEAGNASHYLKTMVVDPNKQISVTYANASGKTVATALAGLTPDNVEALPSNNGTGVDVTKTLLLPPDFNKDYTSATLLGTTSFTAPVSGNYVFNYQFTPLRLDVLHGNSNQYKICNTCYYDLNITVKDNCSQVLATISNPVNPNTIFQTDCNIVPPPVTGNFSVPIGNIGEYTVVYQLIVSERALSFYDSVHLVQNTNIRTFESFVIDQLNKSDFTNCFNDCKTCLVDLGTRSDFINNKIKTFFNQPPDSIIYSPGYDAWANNLYDILLAHCNSIQSGCVADPPCNEGLELLLEDVKPGGQYALFEKPLDPNADYYLLEPSINVLSQRFNVTYYNEDGTPAQIELNGVPQPANSSLISLKLFIANFQDKWAESLVQFHPEYCFYQWCLQNSNSTGFDREVESIDDPNEAITKGYFGAPTSLLAHDPFFLGGGYGYLYYLQMQDSLNLFSRTIPGYNGSDRSILQYVDYELYCEEEGIDPNSCNPNAGCRSQYLEWYTYKNYYLNLKQYFFELARLDYDPNCKNCFIGTDFTTELGPCVAPAPSDFSVEIDYTYTGSGRRIKVKYKNGESAVSHNLLLTIQYNYSTLQKSFRATMGTETYIVPSSAGDFYSVVTVACDNSSGGGNRANFSSELVTVAKVSSGAQAMSMPSCPCPTTEQFFAYTDWWDQCDGGYSKIKVNYYGDPIPPCRTVYVDVSYYEYNTGLSGITTVVFYSGQSSSYSCLYYPFSNPDFYLSVQSVNCYDDACFQCGGNSDPVSMCKDDPRYETYKNKIRRYTGYVNPRVLLQSFQDNQSTYEGDAQDGVAANCQSLCEAQADVWINAISKCTTNQATLDAIRTQLISICQGNCSIDRPFGASDYPGGLPSFESVIRNYFPNFTENCSSDLISDPYPNNSQPQFENRNLIKIDNCLTSRFSELKNIYLASGYAGSYHQWLQKQLREDYLLTQQQLTELETAISNNCKYLKQPMVLPVAFNCGTSPCADSAKIMQYRQDFITKYPGLTNASANYETLLTNYFNHRLGYALSYDRYDEYIQKCLTGTTNKDLLCNQAVTKIAADTSGVKDCMKDVFTLAYTQAITQYTVYIDSVRLDFRNRYLGKCMNVEPKMTMNAKLYEYHYTLYYYDQSGNLVKTIPPAGVTLLNDAQVTQVKGNRDNTNNYCFNNMPEFQFGSQAFNFGQDASYNPVGGEYTLESWTKLSNFNNQGIYSYNYRLPSTTYENGFSLQVRNGKLAFIVGFTPKLDVETPLLSNMITTGSWFHLVIKVNNNASPKVEIFINGNKQPLNYLNNNSPYFYTIPGYYGNLKIGGAFENNITTYMTGGLKQFRWYHRLLSTSEVIQNYSNNCLLPSSSTALVSHIPINEGVGGGIGDLITQGGGQFENLVDLNWLNVYAAIYPAHNLPNNYEYNSYNGVVKQTSPDGGSSQFWYDAIGRLVVAQNSEQKTPKNTANTIANRYTYTKYDMLGRITEVGEKNYGGDIVNYDPKNSSLLNLWYGTGTDVQITETYYDQPNTLVVTNTTITNLQYANSRKRIVSTLYRENRTNGYYDFGTHYVYDVAGNVKTLFQELKPLKDVAPATQGLKRINYEFDLVSGKTNKVIYQPGSEDQFIHKYEYDAENRLRSVSTSRNGLLWQRDAQYYYYLHGPLARMELAQYKVQGVDYAYTLQGWMKGINGQKLDANNEMAGDGDPANPAFKSFGRDVYAFSIGYHSNDYKPIGPNANAFSFTFTPPTGPLGSSGNTGSQLFNGNISNTTLALNKINNAQAVGYSYLYDQLNRLTATKQHNISGSNWIYSTYNEAYRERASYDANGNIITYFRNSINAAGTWQGMDNLAYSYYYNATDNTRKEFNPGLPLPADVKTLTNHLAHVDDDLALTGNETVDIDDQSIGNYDYDNIGNLIKDNVEGLANINWTVYGKIKQINKGTGIDIQYGYDVTGNRVFKNVVNDPNGINKLFYIRDAKGNTMGIYKYSGTNGLTWEEEHLYGSSRLGVWNWGKAPYTAGQVVAGLYVDSIMQGAKTYELSNHLTNVLVTINDKKIGVSSNNTTVDYYNAEVLEQNDYYPFGMVMPRRKYQLGQYRYGFNGKENDNEIKGTGNQQDYGMRIYDARLGRFLSVDPLTKSYPWYTPYQFAGNTPIQAVDLDGEEEIHFSLCKNPDGSTELTLTNYIERKVRQQNWFDKLFGIKPKANLDICVEYKNTNYWFNDRPDPWANDGDDFGYFVDAPDQAIHDGTAKSGQDFKVDWYQHNLRLETMEQLNANQVFAFRIPGITPRASVGKSATNSYGETFFEANPKLRGQVIVHHAVEQQVLKRYSGVFTNSEIQSLQNLRGIPIDKNSTLHLSTIRKLWNNFYRTNKNPTRDDFLNFATEIDAKFGHLFKPVAGANSVIGGFNFSRGFIITLGLDMNENSEARREIKPIEGKKNN